MNRRSIAVCGECPFIETHYNTGRFHCNAEAWLHRTPETRPLGHPGEDGHWRFPPTPPEWCPLRRGSISVSLAPVVEGVGFIRLD